MSTLRSLRSAAVDLLRGCRADQGVPAGAGGNGET
jgi:hypothetical protein